MGDVNRDYHRRVRLTRTDATAASLVLRDGRASVSSGEPFTPPMATRTPRGSATTRRGDAVSAAEETRRPRSDRPSPVAPLP